MLIGDSIGETLFGANLETKQFEQLAVADPGQVRAVAYDHVRSMVFWAYSGNSVSGVASSYLDGTNQFLITSAIGEYPGSNPGPAAKLFFPLQFRTPSTFYPSDFNYFIIWVSPLTE